MTTNQSPLYGAFSVNRCVRAYSCLLYTSFYPAAGACMVVVALLICALRVLAGAHYVLSLIHILIRAAVLASTVGWIWI